MINVKYKINSAMMVENNGGVKGEMFIHREVRKNLKGKSDKPLPGVNPVCAAKWIQPLLSSA